MTEDNTAAKGHEAKEPPVVLAADRKTPRWRRVLPFAGLAVLVWLLSRLDLGDMGTALSRVTLATLLFSSGSFLTNALLKAVRWQRMLLAQGIALPPKVTHAAFMAGQFYGQVTLGRVGELFRVEALIERGVSTGSALSSSILDRLLDLFFVLVAGAVCGAFVLGNTQVAIVALALMIAGGIGAWMLIEIVGNPAPPQRVTSFLQGLAARPLLDRVGKLVRELAAGMYPMTRPRPLLEALAWTAAGWSFYLLALFVLADGLHIVIPKVVLTAAAAFAALSALLPVTISGLGARELIYIAVLKKHGIAEEPAAVLSLLHLFIMTITASAYGFAGVVWRSRQKL